MDHEQRRQQQQRSLRGNAPESGGGASSGKHKGGGKKPIKVVYISNPMRVKTSAAGFRALVQELTGRDADPSKYSPDELAGVGGAGAEDATAAADIDYGAAHGFSPGGAAASRDSPTAAADHHPDDASAVSAPYGADYEEEEEKDGFGSELLQNNYAVLSPPTLLYDHHPHSKAWCSDEKPTPLSTRSRVGSSLPAVYYRGKACRLPWFIPSPDPTHVGAASTGSHSANHSSEARAFELLLHNTGTNP